MTRPHKDETLMDVARSFARQSTCSRHQVGAVLAMDHRVISTGYNGAPVGMPHCDHACICPRDWGGGDGPNPDVDGHRDQCPADSPCTLSVHAEVNAVAFAARYGIQTMGTDLYTTLAPCYPCAQLLINAGILRVWYDRPYRDDRGLKLLEAAGVQTWPIIPHS